MTKARNHFRSGRDLSDGAAHIPKTAAEEVLRKELKFDAIATPRNRQPPNTIPSRYLIVGHVFLGTRFAVMKILETVLLPKTHANVAPSMNRPIPSASVAPANN